MPDQPIQFFVDPSGTMVPFLAPSYITDVVTGDATQQLVITGNPTGGAITLTFKGQTTAPIPTIPSDPYAFFRWNKTGLTPGTYDLYTNLYEGGTASHAMNYEVFDSATSLGSASLNHGTPSANAAPVLDPVLTQRSTGSGNGVPISRYKIGRYTFGTSTLKVRVSCVPISGQEALVADNLWIVTTGGTDVARVQPAIPPAEYATGSLPYSDSPAGYQPLGQVPNMFGTAGTGIGTRYLLDPAVVQSALEALSTVGVGNVLVTGNGDATTPMRIAFRNALGVVAQPHFTFTPNDGTIAITDYAVGGILPVIKKNGTIVPTPREYIYYPKIARNVPFGWFAYPQPLPAAFKYSIPNQHDNELFGEWPTPYDGGPTYHAGYDEQTYRAIGIGPTATFYYRPTPQGVYRVSVTHPIDAAYSTDVSFTIEEPVGSILVPVASTVGSPATIDASGGVLSPAVPRTVTVTLSGDSFDMLGGSAVVHGTDSGGGAISETLPAFAAHPMGLDTGGNPIHKNAAVTAAGSTTFQTVTSITLPAQGSVNLKYSARARVGTYHIDQTVAPTGTLDGGVRWKVLATVTLGRSASGGHMNGLVVTQANNTSSMMVADAVRFETVSLAQPTVTFSSTDTVTVTAGRGWLTTPDGPAAASADAAATNVVGGTIYSPDESPAALEVGYNVPVAYSSTSSFTTNRLYHNDSINSYPTTLGSPDGGINLAGNQTTYGGDRRAAASMLPGDYDVLWKGASELSFYSPFPTGQTPIAGRTIFPGTDGHGYHRKTSTFSAGALDYGALMQLTVHTTDNTVSSAPYPCDFSDVWVVPRDTDVTAAPKWHPQFLSRLSGVKTLRFLDPLAAIEGGCIDFSDYTDSSAHLSRCLFPNGISLPLSACTIYDYAYSSADFAHDFDRTVGSAVVIDFGTTHHGIQRGRIFGLDGYTGDLAQVHRSDDNQTVPFQVASSHPTFAFPISATKIVTQIGNVSGGDGHGGVQHMTNTIANAGGRLTMNWGTPFPIADVIDLCNRSNANLYFNACLQSSDACLTAIGTYVAQHLNNGLVFRFEIGNEPWNFTNSVCSYLKLRTKLDYGGDYLDWNTAYCEIAHNAFTLVKAAWVAAGRSAGDFKAVMGGQMAGGGFTHDYANYFNLKGWAPFDSLAVANYMTCSTGIGAPPYQREFAFHTLVDSMVPSQMVTAFELYRSYGGYLTEVQAHKDQAVNGGGSAYAGLEVGMYEGGFDILRLQTRDDDHPWAYPNPNNGYINHALQRHPRMYGILGHALRLVSTGGGAYQNIFMLQGSDTMNLEAWGTYRAAGQLPYAPGDPTQDAIQSDQVDRQDLVQSIAGGAVKHFATLYGASAPDYTIALTPSSRTTTQGTPTTFTVAMTAAGGYSGTATLSVTGLPSGVTLGSFSPTSLTGGGTTTSTLTLNVSGSATTGTATIGVTATDSANGLSHNGSAQITVNAPVAPDFTLAVSGSGTLTQGSATTRTVTLTASGGYVGTAVLSATGLPSGVTASFSPTSVTGGGTVSSTLTLTASGSASPGSVTATVTGTDSANSLAHSGAFGLTVATSGGGGSPVVPAILNRLRALRRMAVK